MQPVQVKVSQNFKKMATKAVLSILLFIGIYLILFVTAIALTIGLGYAGISIMILRPSFATLIIGIGMICIGFLILFFLVKFMFQVHKVDRSHLIEVTRDEEPALFAFIDNIVNQVQTNSPKKIYLSSEVNAAVFYDSSFWSMFFPVKKNLQIGMGLVNTISVSEFRAILAHEFGHFSQKTMKVGSYVYNVNKVIYNMLYENDSYQRLVDRLASIHGYITFFVRIALYIVSGIQRILKKIYNLININYMALSREMEFHADEVAANVAGSAPLINSLLRLDLANHSLDAVIDYYNGKIESAIATKNLYPQQQFVMNFLAERSKLKIENNLPQVPTEHLSRYNKSKLNIKDQWSSHPSTEDRISALQQLNKAIVSDDLDIAIKLFSNINQINAVITEKLFSNVKYAKQQSYINTDDFLSEFTNDYKANSFDDLYNAYYDHKNPIYNLDQDLDKNAVVGTDIETLFSDDAVDLVYKSIALKNDIETLNQIIAGNTGIKTFDYDGEKYTISDCHPLVSKMDEELQDTKQAIAKNDVDILNFFYATARSLQREDELLALLEQLSQMNKEYDTKIAIWREINNDLNFLQHTTPFAVIAKNFENLKPKEELFKEQIRNILTEEIYQNEITTDIKEKFEDYLKGNYTYFWDFSNEYNDAGLDVLFDTLQNYRYLILKGYFNAKKSLLDFQVGIAPKKSEIAA